MYNLLHVSAPTCHAQTVIVTKKYKPTCQYIFYINVTVHRNIFLFK